MPRAPVKLILGLIFFQTVGDFEAVWEEFYKNCDEKVIGMLEIHPAIMFHLHFSGNLLEYLLHRHLDYIIRLKN
ncbi:MAG: hypothetical protein SGI98_06685 [Verrucomicrobiota bacterium]|nr:hypothetical protein [Verrucomicrobiota bacterium]